MQWAGSPHGGFTAGRPYMEMVKGDLDFHHVNVAQPLSGPDSLLRSISKMSRVRKAHPAFGRGTMNWIETGNPAVAVYSREYADETLLIFNNLSGSPQKVSIPSGYYGRYVNLLKDSEQTITSSLILEAYEYLWLRKQ